MDTSACKGFRKASSAQLNAFRPVRCFVRPHISKLQPVTQSHTSRCRASSRDSATAPSAGHLAAGTLLLAAACSDLLVPGAAHALELHAEPGNALSLPTWAIHVSSVLEWVTAMGLMWRYAEASGNPRWKGMAWGMLPSLGSAMAACTWHFFYNSPDLEFLVVVQSALTVIGNCTCWWAAYRIYEAAMAEKSSA
ncbi:hypothetical protein PLESTB_001354400 [Pleodorina starrii]|uniref:Ycf49-like protein n=1 Tax=Pleodorina starrii TaxID=330485 RepID=A0A9W6BUP1_9CHLO|nr:hypothetical protein PLESTM_001914200 [Pleodorina starrii]GLC58398.1 hypothetical protein PLESTB_001354400 [Pleodorina starrii]GLC76461.1 hypothetical protein PLESTF_001783800 [Pleodorina starrii]